MPSLHYLRPLLVATALTAMAACTTAANGGDNPGGSQSGNGSSASADPNGSNSNDNSSSSSNSSKSHADGDRGSSGGEPGMIADGADFTMQPGQSVTLADHSHLRYLRMVNDSRCPPDVQCVWAGNAELAFEWKPSDGGAQAFSLNTGQGDKDHVLGQRRLTLVSVASGAVPAAQLRIQRVP